MNIIPIGLSCLIANSLKENKLRTKSYPFDWVLNQNNNPNHIFDTIIKILKTDKKDIDTFCLDFFDKNKNIGRGIYGYINNPELSYEYINKDYKIIYIHEKNYENMITTQTRRIHRFYDDFYNKEKYLYLVYVSRTEKNDVDILNFIDNILKLRNENINFIIVNSFVNSFPDLYKSYIQHYIIEYKEEYTRNGYYLDKFVYEVELSKLFLKIFNQQK